MEHLTPTHQPLLTGEPSPSTTVFACTWTQERLASAMPLHNDMQVCHCQSASPCVGVLCHLLLLLHQNEDTAALEVLKLTLQQSGQVRTGRDGDVW